MGDVDLDGFPDLLLTLYNTSLGPPSAAIAETMLLLNTHCGQFAACHPYWRQFQVERRGALGQNLSSDLEMLEHLKITLYYHLSLLKLNLG